MKKNVVFVMLAVLLTASALPENICAQYRYNGHRCINVDDYSQYVPAVAGLTLGFTGVETEHCLTDRLLVEVTSFASTALMVKGLKMAVRKRRPDGSDRSSFPSGHSAIAFMGAKMVREEYGWGYGACAYTVAAGTAFLRVYNGRHDVWDVLAGACAGVLGTRIGYWLLSPEKKLFSAIFRQREDMSPALALVPAADYRTGTAGVSFVAVF